MPSATASTRGSTREMLQPSDNPATHELTRAPLRSRKTVVVADVTAALKRQVIPFHASKPSTTSASVPLTSNRVHAFTGAHDLRLRVVKNHDETLSTLGAGELTILLPRDNNVDHACR